MTAKNALKFSLQLLFCLLAENIHAQPDTGKREWHTQQTFAQLSAAPAALIPFPQKATWSKELFSFNAETAIAYRNDNEKIIINAVRSLKELLIANGVVIRTVNIFSGDQELNNSILLHIDKNLAVKAEGYSLEVNSRNVKISAKDAAGLYYGVQTLRQLIQKKKNMLCLPGCNITDWPAFALRGFMHDNGRNFQSISALKEQLDKLSHYKYNTFQWHLTDNPAWRPQSRIYPQLNKAENRNPGRDPDSSYSFEDIRELIQFSKERNITIIPELDMPGHSKYFEPTFGVKMESEQGMKILEQLIDEFCSEISAVDCPIIHIGSDEVHIANPDVFITRMTARVKANGRKVMVWNPGLPPIPGTIEQVWMDDATKGERKSNNPFVDSYGGYLNYFDAYTLVQRFFFQQICNKPFGDSLALGGIVCCWPDTRVEDKSKIALHNPVWPGALAYSEAVWCGRPVNNSEYMSALPKNGISASRYFREFESRLAYHRDIFFVNEHFPYVQFGNIEWELSGPYYRSTTDSIDKAFGPEKEVIQDAEDKVKAIKVTGGVIHMNDWLKMKPLSNVANETVYLTSYIKSGKQNIHAVIGFETAARSNRRSAGLPANGKWDANGGAVFINGTELKGPKWNDPGGNRYLKATWETPGNEIPFTDEEFYWSRPPAAVPLKKGYNKILVRVPRTFKDQNWQFVFIPVKMKNGKWVEDMSIKLEGKK